MIPELVDIGGPWEVLPPGIHDASLEEVRRRFATTDRRRALHGGIVAGCAVLRSAGCPVVYIDGSYVTAKPNPGDFDLCWDPTGVDDARLDPVLLDFSDRRRKQKARFGGEFFPSSARADGRLTFLEFFQVDKDTGKQKGVVRVLLQ